MGESEIDIHFQYTTAETKLNAANGEDAGALFVLESKGSWVHAGYHLTTAIVAPACLSLPYAFAGLGWVAGTLALVLGASVTFYSYNLLATVLEHCANDGRRHLRFRDLSRDIMGPFFTKLLVIPIQFLVCFGAVVACILLGGESLKIIYRVFNPHENYALDKLVSIFGAVFVLLSQLPSFHSLRHVNLVSLILALGYSVCVFGGCIYAGRRKDAPPKNYSLVGNQASKLFGAFNSLAIIATSYGNGIIPEIQATLIPPATGKMFKGLLICYSVVLASFFLVSFSGYWAFGNQSNGNIFSNFSSTVPKWLIVLANVFVIMQLFAVALVYSQPTFEVFEGTTADVRQGRFSYRNLLPRILLRTGYVVIATLIAAMFPFFGDINAIIGAFGFTPLDFVFPMLFYLILFKPSKLSFKFWINTAIIILFILVGLMGSIAAVRQLILDAKTYQVFANLV